jgi:hypothetical protein
MPPPEARRRISRPRRLRAMGGEGREGVVRGMEGKQGRAREEEGGLVEGIMPGVHVSMGREGGREGGRERGREGHHVPGTNVRW